MSTPSPEYLIDMANRSYPFRDGSNHALVTAISDLYFFGSPAQDVVLSDFTDVGTGIRFILQNFDDDSVVFDTAAADDFVSSTYGIWTVYEWYNDHQALKVVAHTDRLAAIPSASNLDLFLGARNVEVPPERLTSIIVDNIRLSGDIQLRSGFNIQTVGTPSDGTIRRTSSILLDVVPGAGEGYYLTDCDEATNYVATINGIGADKFGNLQFNTDNCYTLLPNPGDSSIDFSGMCSACLKCTDVQAGYTRLSTLHARAANVRERLCQAIVVYDDYVRLLKQLADALNNFRVRVQILKTGGNVFSLQTAVQVGRYPDVNGVPADISSLVINIAFSDIGASGTLVGYSGLKKLPTEAWTAFEPTAIDARNVQIFYAGDKLKANTYAEWSVALGLANSSGSTVTVAVAATATYTSGLVRTFSEVNVVTLDS
jgi:hypothetical protein